MIEVKAAVLTRMSEEGERLAGSDVLQIETLHLDAPGTGEVSVRVHSAGLCHSDLSVINGSRPRPLPMVLGHEGSGVVVETGDGVDNVAEGDHVVFSFVPACGSCVDCLSGRPALCKAAAAANGAGTLLSGAQRFARADGEPLYHHLGVSCFAEQTVVSARSVVKIDPTVDLGVAVLFGCGLLTGIGAISNTARVEQGASVAVFGLGGVGLAAVMGARLAGAHPIVAIDPVVEKHEHALNAGATHVLVPGDDTAAEIASITDGGADFTFEAVGSAAVLAAAYEATGRGGTTVAIGLPHPSQQLQIPAVSLVGEERMIRGSYMGSAVPVRDIPRLLGLHLAGKLPVDGMVSGTLHLDQISEGFDALADAQVIRQIVQFDS